MNNNAEEITLLKNRIKKLEGEIENLQGKINTNRESLKKRYFELRMILEDERNHEDKFICNPLNPKKLMEYKIILNIFKETCIIFKKEDEANNRKIKENFEEIEKIKDGILKLEKINEIDLPLEKLEEDRRDNMTKIINFLKDKDQYKDYYNVVNDIMNKK